MKIKKNIEKNYSFIRRKLKNPIKPSWLGKETGLCPSCR
jgi:hypothetical protein